MPGGHNAARVEEVPVCLVEVQQCLAPNIVHVHHPAPAESIQTAALIFVVPFDVEFCSVYLELDTM